MVDVSSSGDDEVGSDVVGGVVVLDVLAGDVGQVFSDSLDGLSHEMISVGGVVDSLEGGLLLVLDTEGRSEEWISFSLELVLVVGGVEEEISEEVNGLVEFAGFESEGVSGGFSGWGDGDVSSQEIQFLLDLFSGSLLSSSKVQFAQELNSSRGFKGLLSGSGLDEDLEGSQVGGGLFGSNLNSILEGGQVKWQIVLKSFWDNSSWQLTKISQSLLRKL